MKIKSLYLENFIGIKHGLDKYKLKLLFPDNDNKFVMLLGDNGSGKSTIMSQLQPYNDSFDDKKKELVLEGRVGIKELVIIDGDDEYICHITIGKTSNYSFKKNGEELNTSFKVTPYEKLLTEHLGITREFPYISKMGSNTSSFVGFSTTERKDYIGKLITMLDKFTKAYNTVTDKFRLLKNKLKGLSDNLLKYESEDTLVATLERHKEILEQFEKEIIKNSNEIAVDKARIETLRESIKEFNYTKELEDNTLLNTQKNALEKNNSILKNKYPDFSILENDYKNLENLNDELTKLITELAVKENNIKNLEKRITENNNNKFQVENKLKGVEKGDLSVLKSEIESLNQLISEDLEVKNSLPITKFINEGENVSLSYETFKQFTDYMILNFHRFSEVKFSKLKLNKSDYLNPNIEKILFEEASIVRKKISEKQKELTDETEKLGTKRNNLSKLDILDQRPKDCKDDTCPFIKDALQYINVLKEIEELNKTTEKFKKEVSELEVMIEDIEELRGFVIELHKYYSEMKVNNSTKQYFESEYKTFDKLIVENTKMEITETLKDIYEMLEDYVYLNTNIIANEKTLETKKKLNETLTSSEELVKHYNEEIKKCEDINAKLDEEIKSIRESFTIEELIKNEKESYIKDLKNYGTYLKHFNNIINALRVSNDNIKKIEETNKEITDIETIKLVTSETNLSKIKEAKTNVEELKQKNETDLAMVRQYKADELELKDTYEETFLVKEALNPKSGIPLVFINAYLGETERIANEFLNLAFEGKFEIKFVPTAKDFFIQVRSGNEIKSDIKLVSQGEMALMTISISLALIEQSINRFNIIWLDEMDGALDAKNRDAFINIINSQIQRLGLEQIFIISHNKSFDNIPMNLIMLKGSEDLYEDENFMRNKEVVYKVF